RSSAGLALPGFGVKRELAAHARDRVVHVLAQHDPAAVQLDLEHAALGQAQCVADGLGERDLAALGNDGFHGCPPMRGTVCMDYTYFQMHTFAHILAPRAGPPPEFPSGRRRLGPGEQRKRTAMPATTR